METTGGNGHYKFTRDFLEKEKMEKYIKKLDDNYTWYGKAAIRINKKGRASGGHLIGIKKNLNISWKARDWEYGIKIELEKGKEEKYIIITGYNNKPANMKTFLKKLDQELDEIEGSPFKTILIGDLNARIGEGQRVSECGMDEFKVAQIRKSEDKEIRREGKLLLNWCESRAILIMNGRSIGDEDGKITCIGHGGGLGSVLDLVMVKMNEEEPQPTWFKGMKVTV